MLHHSHQHHQPRRSCTTTDRLNGDSAYGLVKALLPGMVARRRGFVLLVSR